MLWLREIWAAIRDTAFVAAQVVTLGVLAMVLGLIALNAIVHQPSTRSASAAGPSRPLSVLVPTLVPDTPTPVATPAPATPIPSAETPSASLPEAVATAAAQRPGWTPPPLVSPTPPPPTPTAPPPPSPTPAPASPTPAPSSTPQPAASPTSAVPGQMMKVLPAADGLPARLRAEPTTKAPILVRVPLGASVEVIGTANGDELQPGNPRWLHVRWRDQTGYIYSTLVGG